MSSLSNKPDDVIFVINRLGYGPRAEEFNDILKQGVAGWLDDQLAAPAADDPAIKKRIDACTLHIKYDAADGKWSAVDEMRPMTSYSKPIEEIWPVLFEPGKQINGQERGRPRLETISAIMIRAVYSRYPQSSPHILKQKNQD